VAGQKFVVEDNNIGFQIVNEDLDLIDFAGADVGGGVGVDQALDGFADDDQTGGVGQPGQFGQTFFDGTERPFSGQFNPDEEGFFLRGFGLIGVFCDKGTSF
jgi:hypothetical protein